MANIPRKCDEGYKHEVFHEEGKSTWTVDGPGLFQTIYTFGKDDAELVAAALNFAHNYAVAKRRAAELAGTLEFFSEFK